MQHFLGLAGMPRRIRTGPRAAQKPWEGADSLDWTHLPTPAPYHSFETAPVIH